MLLFKVLNDVKPLILSHFYNQP